MHVTAFNGTLLLRRASREALRLLVRAHLPRVIFYPVKHFSLHHGRARSINMDGRIFQDFSGRAFGDATDAYELNPYSEDVSTPELPHQSAESNAPRYTLTESYAPTPPSSYPLTEPYAPPQVAAGPRQVPGNGGWRGGQLPPTNGGLRRYQTRKVKLVQGVLTIDYPVPRAILNSNQTRYISDIRDGEFTKMTCRFLSSTQLPPASASAYYEKHRHGSDLRPKRIYPKEWLRSPNSQVQ